MEWTIPAPRHPVRADMILLQSRLIRSSLGVETCDEAVLHFMGVGQDVRSSNFTTLPKIVLPQSQSGDGAWLDDMLPLSSQKFFVEDRARGQAA